MKQCECSREYQEATTSLDHHTRRQPPAPSRISRSGFTGTLGCSILILMASVASIDAGGLIGKFWGVPWESGIVWPKPKRVVPGQPGEPPSDAIVLFDGKDLSQWYGGKKWIVRDGVAIVGKGDLTSRQSFGDCQLHLEWATPAQIKGNGQARGNSGVFFMGIYELQIMDSYENETNYDGQAGAIYKQRPPLVNVCRKPGEWQNYDVIFRAPQFDSQGNWRQPAAITAFQNGVLIQDHFELVGLTNFYWPPACFAHAPKLPLRLQNHGCPVRFRNIWIRELDDVREDLMKPFRDRMHGSRPSP